jgi:hypothetical protein
VALDAPVDQIANAAQNVVRIARTENPRVQGSYIANVAQTYVARGMLLDRVPALIKEAIQNFDDPEGVIEIDLDPSGHDRTLETRMEQVSWHVIALATLSDATKSKARC